MSRSAGKVDTQVVGHIHFPKMLMHTNEEITSKVFLAFAGMLMAVGVLMVYSSSMTSRSVNAEQIYLSRHIVFLGIALTCGGLASQLPARFWYFLTPVLYVLCVALLVATLIPGVGHRVNGAQRWLRFGSISFQPSELTKLVIPLLICRIRMPVSDKSPGPLWKQTSSLLVLIGVPLGLLLIEPDLGTTLFIVGMSAVTLFLSNYPLRMFAILGSLTIPAVASLFVLKPYQLARIQGFIATWTNPEAAPYQVQQSLTTLGVGGLHGAGLGRGWQKLSFLPEANTDFIFAVIGEELGLMGTLGMMLLWLGLFVTGIRLIRKPELPSFQSTVALALLLQLILQAAINIAVVTAMAPPKGISHPLLSYGGSNLVTSVTTLGMILSLTRIPQPVSAPEPEIDFDIEFPVPTT